MMNRKKLYLMIQTVLCILLAVLLAAAVIRIWMEGTAVRETTDPLAYIFTRELALKRLAPIGVLFLITAGMAAAGLILGISGADWKTSGTEKARDKARETAGESAKDKSAMPGTTPARVPGNRTVNAVRIAVIAAALVMIVLGVNNGSMRDVFVKAVNLCTECVGLG